MNLNKNALAFLFSVLFLLTTVSIASAAPPKGSYKIDPQNVFITNSPDRTFNCGLKGSAYIPGSLMGKNKDIFYPLQAKIKNLKKKAKGLSGSAKTNLQKKIKKLQAQLKISKPLCQAGPPPPPPPATVLPELARAITAEDVHHLYRRAGLGVPPAQAFAYVGQPVATLVDFLMTPVDDSAVEAEARLWLDEDPAAPHYPDVNARPTLNGLQLYVLRILAKTSNQFHERLALLGLHDRFATSSVILTNNTQRYLMIDHLGLLRTRGAKEFNYAALLEEIGEDPVMVKWLSLDQNNLQSPNENYARELMELFSLDTKNSAGQDTYNDEDIKQVSRAFTGWNVLQFGNEWRTIFTPASFDSDPGKVIFASTAHQGVVQSSRDVVKHILANHPNAGQSLAKWLAREYLREDASQAIIDELSALLKASNYNLGDAFRKLLRSEEFYKVENQLAIAKRPVDRTIHLVRLMETVGMPYDFRGLRGMLFNAGCVVTQPETVFGCDLEDLQDGQRLLYSANLITSLSNNNTLFTQNGWTYNRFFPNAAPTIDELIVHFEGLFGVKLTETQKVSIRSYLDCVLANGSGGSTIVRCQAGDAWSPADTTKVRTRVAGLFRIFATLPQIHDLR